MRDLGKIAIIGGAHSRGRYTERVYGVGGADRLHVVMGDEDSMWRAVGLCTVYTSDCLSEVAKWNRKIHNTLLLSSPYMYIFSNIKNT